MQPGYKIADAQGGQGVGELRHRGLGRPRREARREEQRRDDLSVQAGAVPVGQVRDPGFHVPVPRRQRSQRHARAGQRADRRRGHFAAGRSAGQAGDRGYRGRRRDAQAGSSVVALDSGGARRRGGPGRMAAPSQQACPAGGPHLQIGARDWPTCVCGPWWPRISSSRARSRSSTSRSAASCGTTSRTGSTCTPRSARRRSSWRSCGSPRCSPRRTSRCSRSS